MNTEIRLIEHGEMPGSWNMAIDQAILLSVVESEIPVLRLYRWEPATVSLGYFQAFASSQNHAPSKACPLVRRSTGGGAIVHDRELTYSLCLPSDHPWTHDHQQMVRTVHEVIIETLREFGVEDCQLHGETPPESRQAPYLCYQRRTRGDLTLQGHKIVGSAQRKIQGAILQHGSILEQRSPHAPELPGILDLIDSNYDSAAFGGRWAAKIVKKSGLISKKSELNRKETGQAMEIEIQKFGHDSWTEKR